MRRYASHVLLSLLLLESGGGSGCSRQGGLQILSAELRAQVRRQVRNAAPNWGTTGAADDPAKPHRHKVGHAQGIDLYPIYQGLLANLTQVLSAPVHLALLAALKRFDEGTENGDHGHFIQRVVERTRQVNGGIDPNLSEHTADRYSQQRRGLPSSLVVQLINAQSEKTERERLVLELTTMAFYNKAMEDKHFAELEEEQPAGEQRSTEGVEQGNGIPTVEPKPGDFHDVAKEHVERLGKDSLDPAMATYVYPADIHDAGAKFHATPTSKKPSAEQRRAMEARLGQPPLGIYGGGPQQGDAQPSPRKSNKVTQDQLSEVLTQANVAEINRLGSTDTRPCGVCYFVGSLVGQTPADRQTRHASAHCKYLKTANTIWGDDAKARENPPPHRGGGRGGRAGRGGHRGGGRGGGRRNQPRGGRGGQHGNPRSTYAQPDPKRRRQQH